MNSVNCLHAKRPRRAYLNDGTEIVVCDDCDAGVLFITDAGHRVIAVFEDGTEFNVGRYAVWAPRSRDGKPEVIDTGDDLDALRRKHGPVDVIDLERGTR